jgi:hypothetical protein
MAKHHFSSFQRAEICELLKCQAVSQAILVQPLWSDMGGLWELSLDGYAADHTSVMVKWVDLSRPAKHPRGWNSNRSNQRKLKSYEVERTFYRDFSSSLSQACRVPKILAQRTTPESSILVLENLNDEGYPFRRSECTDVELDSCLKWLAEFHGHFLGRKPVGLWEVGCYWHLDTRPDEWEAMEEGELKKYASDLDRVLRSGHYQTLLHGDAKVANFCFASDGKVAGLDFQYVGAGCGMKDLAYFLGSCIPESDLTQRHEEFLGKYFDFLEKATKAHGIEFLELEREWRMHYALACADFERFIQGWMPSHWKRNAYSGKMTKLALKYIKT